MRGEDFTAALQTLGLDTQAASKWLGVSVRAVQRYRVSGAPKMAERLIFATLSLLSISRIQDKPYGEDYEEIREARFIARLALDWRE